MADDRPGPQPRRQEARSRREALRYGAALVGGTLAAPVLAAADGPNLPPNVPEWMTYPGADTGSQPYGLPSPFEKDVVRSTSTGKQYASSASRTPLQDLDGIITPNGLFYERHHGGVPEIDPAQHRLMVHGLVERPLVFTMEDIRRFRRSPGSTSSNAPETRATPAG